MNIVATKRACIYITMPREMANVLPMHYAMFSLTLTLHVTRTNWSSDERPNTISVVMGSFSSK